MLGVLLELFMLMLLHWPKRTVWDSLLMTWHSSPCTRIRPTLIKCSTTWRCSIKPCQISNKTRTATTPEASYRLLQNFGPASRARGVQTHKFKTQEQMESLERNFTIVNSYAITCQGLSMAMEIQYREQ